jgi:small-conductance mechanosensitive channel
VLAGPDEISIKIPNCQMANQQVSNISRATRSQVKQELWFSYDDIDKLSVLILDIKDEIRKACPKLITDGSRPFRVHWREFKNDHLEVVVDCRFDLPPTGNPYWDNRQKVLEAIAAAAAKNKVSFSIPTYAVKAGDERSDTDSLYAPFAELK